MNEKEGTPIGVEVSDCGPLFMHTLGELDNFVGAGHWRMVMLYLTEPGEIFGKSWFKKETFMLDRETKGAAVGKQLWKVVLCGNHADLIDDIFKRTATLNASLVLQNTQALKLYIGNVRSSANKHRVPVILLNKPLNRGKRELGEK